MKIDLHTHTTCSDGQLTPQELVMRAQQMQVDMLAITDHDNIDGLPLAREAIEQFNAKVRLINGVEISTKWHGFEIHILGLNFDENNQKLIEVLDVQKQKRIQRAHKITQKLAFLGIDELYEKCLSKASGIVSRVHVAAVLVDEGICKDLQQAFTQFLGAKKRAYVSPDWIDMADAINVIRGAKGHAVLAHPFHYDMKSKWIRKLLTAFAAASGDATEVMHPNISPTKRDLIVNLAKELGLRASVGSDFHAPTRWTELGRKLVLPADMTPVWQAWT
ncbi:PHP domain-containing protein [Agaribacter marinus]|nr:PHP domain-containing protein [Agaribacter marinus]